MDGSGDLQTRLNTALRLHQEGELEAALEGYASVSAELSGGAACTVFSNMGAVAMDQGQYEVARAHFSTAGMHDPSNVSAMLNEAIVLTSKLGQHKAAMAKCVRALQLDDANPKTYHLLGNVMQELGRPEQATKYFALAESLATAAAAALAATAVTDGSTGVGGGGGDHDWHGKAWADRSPIAALPLGAKGTLRIGDTDYMLECLSQTPLVVSVRGFLSDAEADHIVNRAGKQLAASFVMGGDGGTERGDGLVGTASREGAYRTSDNAWLATDDDVLNAVQMRLAAVLGLKPSAFAQHSEELQVVHYKQDGEFRLHHDSSSMHPRFLTCLMYLNSLDEDQGGATWFPHTGAHRTVDMSVNEAMAMAAEGGEGMGVQARPAKGNVLIFFNHDVKTGAIDPAAVHSSTKLLASSKWIANWWVENSAALFAQP